MFEQVKTLRTDRADKVRKSAFTVLGYSLSLAFSGLVQSSPATPFAPESVFTDILGAAFQTGYLLTFFLLALFGSVSRHDTERYVAYAAIAAGATSMFLRLLGFALVGRIEISVVMQTFLGASCALMLSSWVCVFASDPTKEAVAELLLGSLGAIALSVLAQFFLPRDYVDAAWTLLLLGSLMTLWFVRRERMRSAESAGIMMDDALVLPAKSLLKELYLPVLCASLLVAIGPVMAFSAINMQYDPMILACAADGGHLASIAALFVILVVLKKRVSLTEVFLVTFPLVATMLLAVSYFGMEMGVPFLAIAYAAYNLMSLMMVITSIRIAKERKLEVMVPFGIMAGFVYSFSTVGAWVGSFLQGFFIDSVPISAITLAILYLLSILAFYVMRLRSKTESRSVDDPLLKRCRTLIVDNGLTEREADILVHLAHGKNVPAIANVMLLSKDTIRTHIKSMYRKLEVHSRQELINLIEQTQPCSE